MNKILVLGAGKSSSVLIDYLAGQAILQKFALIIADASEVNLKERVSKHSHVIQKCGDLNNKEFLSLLIADSSVVISLLPPVMHILIARICIDYSKHLLTASYVSPEMKSLDSLVKSKGLTFINECGLDPGLDHMSAMKLFDDLKTKGAEIKSFRSFCGGLVTPESNDNPWGYKITWNPRNVVLAGQGTAQFIENKKLKIVPYHQLFKRIYPIHFDTYGDYEAYPNRDSISYIERYQLTGIENFIRGTIRTKGFCSAWDKIVQLGLADDTVVLQNANKITVSQFFQLFKNEEVSLSDYLKISTTSEDWKKLKWLGCESEDLIFSKKEGTAAEYIQSLLEQKWKLQDADKDLVLMQHHIEYELDKKRFEIVSSLIVEGENSIETAMAKTVGLPLAMAAIMVLNSKFEQKGLLIPTVKEIYNPILKELQNHKIIFRENA